MVCVVSCINFRLLPPTVVASAWASLHWRRDHCNSPSTETPAAINFYSTADDYGDFSNFAPFPITLKKKRWPTSEHYFQAQKFADKQHQEAIRKANSPMIAARMGRDRKKKLRRDWESVKVNITRRHDSCRRDGISR